MNAVAGDFVWHSQLNSKPSFLDKRDLYINLHRLDASTANFVVKYPNRIKIGTLLHRFWCSDIIHEYRRPEIATNLLLSWFQQYPIQDFYRFE